MWTDDYDYTYPYQGMGITGVVWSTPSLGVEKGLESAIGNQVRR
jgi:hypothetical protein